MNLDFSFIRGTDTPTEAESKPAEARERLTSINIPPQNKTPYRASYSPIQPTADKELIELAKGIVNRYEISKEITEGVMLQLEKDLAENKKNLPAIILYLSEALDRASGGGDQYIKRAEKALTAAGYKA